MGVGQCQRTTCWAFLDQHMGRHECACHIMALETRTDVPAQVWPCYEGTPRTDGRKPCLTSCIPGLCLNRHVTCTFQGGHRDLATCLHPSPAPHCLPGSPAPPMFCNPLLPPILFLSQYVPREWHMWPVSPIRLGLLISINETCTV